MVLENRNKCLELLEERLEARRFRHCLGVEKESIVLAERFGADVQKAALAGLMHDLAKRLSKKEKIEEARRYGINVNSFYEKNPDLLHGYIAAEILKKDFGIDDDEILDAIRYHTTCRPNSTLLDKIVFLADLIEEGRDFDGVDTIRDVALKNLDKATLMGVVDGIHHVLNRGYALDLNSVLAYNELTVKCGYK